VLLHGPFTLARFVSETISESMLRQSLQYLPWLPWAAQHKIEIIYLICGCRVSLLLKVLPTNFANVNEP